MASAPTHLRSFAELQGLLGRMAAQDPAFRARLVAEPKRVFSEAFGVDLPPQLRFEVHEAPADTLILVIPAAPATGELSDEELSGITGGVALGDGWWLRPDEANLPVRFAPELVRQFGGLLA